MKPIQQFDAEALYLELARQIKAAVANLNNVAIVGIYSGGAWLAERLAHDCQIKNPVGYIDVSFYRDDYAQKGLHAEVKTTQIPFEVDGANIILVDDVLFTGRTTRAAINELFDYGRPNQILLACLVDRGGRQLPYAADFVAQQLTLPLNLSLQLQRELVADQTAEQASKLILSLVEISDHKNDDIEPTPTKK
ncbi:bifunctional pyr operon transcriptional regulator/uracil phosphoribosyltransferase PyrR [Solimicrobium silvestre]|uniref:Pyrimidine operon attenuation protein/uracil phosphoribosyltransferase n=1 Tax=Solimicrobium silvestre TaxID=2099400 RepID=A0A2S9GTS4_9BURK|nr:bifunctional pyr operon transcriptional regulator/uracil phosphoribosyltransferase PyrR [Solimicrobium silvestre]PRC91111.1 Pyrimidine operon attenuation protein/uracil phosphoribosyltransferase [Solimicrobium silvestre]